MSGMQRLSLPGLRICGSSLMVTASLPLSLSAKGGVAFLWSDFVTTHCISSMVIRDTICCHFEVNFFKKENDLFL